VKIPLFSFCFFSVVSLRGILEGIVLNGANLSGLDGTANSFNRSFLVGANFSRADLQSAQFENTDLTNADLFFLLQPILQELSYKVCKLKGFLLL
jgi:uncharacterized protein YjbI with pentapeptide repeats